MAVRNPTIVQQNALHWRTNCLSLANAYRLIDPDIIILNSHGNYNDHKIKLFTYNIIHKNSKGERSDGSAICIKKNLPFQQIDGLTPETIAIRIPLRHKHLTIATFYSTPRRDALPVQDIMTLLNHNNPTFIAADMNAKYPLFRGQQSKQQRKTAGNHQQNRQNDTSRPTIPHFHRQKKSPLTRQRDHQQEI